MNKQLYSCQQRHHKSNNRLCIQQRIRQCFDEVQAKQTIGKQSRLLYR